MLLKYARLRHNRETGFTLVELLVVLLIIGVLAAIAIPMFLNQRKSAADATLKSDIKNAVTPLQTWFIKNAGAKEFNATVGSGRSALVAGDHAVNAFPDPATYPRWNDLPGTQKIIVSDQTSMEIPIVQTAWGDWTRPFQNGEICIKASNVGSNYNATLYADSFATLDKSLYYDTVGGGVRTMAELVKLQVTNSTVSCSGYVNRYMSVQP